jgi:hypothetical protein
MCLYFGVVGVDASVADESMYVEAFKELYEENSIGQHQTTPKGSHPSYPFSFFSHLLEG